METNTYTARLWQTDNGRVCCDKHLGYSATAELEANPKSRTLYGGCDTYYRMTKTEITEWTTFLAEHGHNEACEDCREEW